MIVLELAEADARVLEQAVVRRVSDLMNELVHTEARGPHEALRSNYEALERLQRRLTELVSPKSPGG